MVTLDVLTSGQLTLLTLWLGSIVWYLCRRLSRYCTCSIDLDNVKTSLGSQVLMSTITARLPVKLANHDTTQVEEQHDTFEMSSSSSKHVGTSGNETEFRENVPTTTTTEGLCQKKYTIDQLLEAVIIFGIVLIFIYVCHNEQILYAAGNHFNRYIFVSCVLLLTLTGCMLTVQSTEDTPLNRYQTDEWRGWMQVIFVLFHYFDAQEVYKFIRVCVGSYAWMTGFGHFSYFWKKKDFSVKRFLRTQFRLNFLVTIISMVTYTDYMFYYICAMHTYWFLTVYVFMATLTSWNKHRYKMAAKFIIYFVCNFVIFDMGFVAEILQPFNTFITLGYWGYRTTLDHWACFTGMLCAYNFQTFEDFLRYLHSDSMTKQQAVLKKCLMSVLVCVSILLVVCWFVISQPMGKSEYNAIHPGISLLPMFAYICVRNMYPVLRRHYIGMYQWLGTITLELYLIQFHIFLHKDVTQHIVYIPDHPLLNLILASLVYVPISYGLFRLTAALSAILFPDTDQSIGKNMRVLTVILSLLTYTFFKIKGYR